MALAVVTAVTAAATIAVVAMVTMAATVVFVAVVIVLAIAVAVVTLFALLLVAVEPSALDDFGEAVLIATFMVHAFIATALAVPTFMRSLAFGLPVIFVIVFGAMRELRRARSRMIFCGVTRCGGRVRGSVMCFCVGYCGGLLRHMRIGTFLFQIHFSPRDRGITPHLLPFI
jgi:hypothetical protein